MTTQSTLSKFSTPWLSLLILALASGCVSDDDPPSDAGGAGGSGGASAGSGGASGGMSGGSSAGGSSGGSSGSLAGTTCANPIVLSSMKGGIGGFDDYDGSEVGKWSFALGGDSSTGVFTGPFAYGDDLEGMPETFEMGEGHDSMYGVRIADTQAEEYGGGLGLWLSGCIDATAFSGIRFWVRGDSPSPTATLTLSMVETLPVTPATDGGAIGACDGDDTTCKHPSFGFEVTDTWTEVEVPWSAFMPGTAAGAAVRPDGRNITQLQFGVNLVFEPSADDPEVYVPVAAPYELVVDDLAFY